MSIPNSIPWGRVKYRQFYELQAVTSQDARLQDPVGPPFVRLIVDQHYKLAQHLQYVTQPGDSTAWPLGLWSAFGTVEPTTEVNDEHVKQRYCANYVVLRKLSEIEVRKLP